MGKFLQICLTCQRREECQILPQYTHIMRIRLLCFRIQAEILMENLHFIVLQQLGGRRTALSFRFARGKRLKWLNYFCFLFLYEKSFFYFFKKL